MQAIINRINIISPGESHFYSYKINDVPEAILLVHTQLTGFIRLK